jgi:thiol-disulfide isomerase/thioredoxin
LTGPTLSRRSLAAAAVWALGAGRAAAAPAAAPAPSSGRYPFETGVWTGSVLMTADERSFVLRDLQRPMTLLKLWAGWCPACAAEMPQLTAMAAAMGRTLEVILVSYPQFWAADQVAAQRRRLPFKLATFAPSTPASLVQQALQGQEGVYSVPRSLAFRARDQSIVLTRERGADWASAEMLSKVSALVG